MERTTKVGSTYDARARYREEQRKLPGAYAGLRIVFGLSLLFWAIVAAVIVLIVVL